MSTDPRIARTRKRLREALLALIEERDLVAINVQEITQSARVNRTTFYLHYRSKEELLADAIDSLIEEIVVLNDEVRVLIESAPDLNVFTPPIDEPSLYDYFEKRPRLFRKLFQAEIGISFVIKLQRFYEEQFIDIWNARHLVAAPGTPSAEFRARFASGAILAVISKNVVDDTPEKIQDYNLWGWELLLPLWSTMIVDSEISTPPRTTVAELGSSSSVSPAR
ncbi:MAG TPA: TetR/AcrR family transcriptional regulator [Thermomicrobiales bacterium]|nr:TetR/AcrR family transcriptional regulator [Thermomicrobiales bacterium]